MKNPFPFFRGVFVVSQVLVVFFFFQPSWAADIFYDYDKEIVVTGTRTHKVISKAPVKTEVIRDEQIEEYHYKSVDEVLPHLPGVTTQSSSYRPGQFALMQGLGRDHILVLIDGVPQSQNSTLGFDLSQVSMAGVEKIEVIKGGASALYGSQAMGGAINIITKKPTKKLSYDLDFETGRYPDNQIQTLENIPAELAVSVSQKTSSLGYRLYSSARHRAAVNRNTQSISQDQAEIIKLDGGALIFFEDKGLGKYSLNYRTFYEKIEGLNGVPSPLTGVEGFLNGTKLTNQNISLSGEKKISKSQKLNGFFYHERVFDERVLGDDIKTEFTEGRKISRQITTRFETQYDFDIWENHLMTLGLVWNHSKLDQKSFALVEDELSTFAEVDDKSYESFQFFIQDDIVYNFWEWVPGFRIQSDRDFGTNMAPKLSVSHNTKALGQKAILRSSVALGYRVPSLKQRYYYLDHTSIASYTVEGDNNLKAENSLNYQLGLEFVFSQRSSFYVNIFSNKVNNLIGTQISEQNSSQNSPVTIYKYGNIEDVDIYGVEGNMRAEFLSCLRGEFSLTYTLTENRKTGKKIPLRPLWFGRWAFNLGSPGWDFSLNTILTYTGSQFTDPENVQKTPGFTTFDFRMNYKWTSISTFYLGVENLFDVTRPVLLDDASLNTDLRPGVGRYVYLGFKLLSK